MKTITMIIVFAFVLVGIAMTFFAVTSSENNKRSYKRIAYNLASTVALVVNTTDAANLRDEVKGIVDGVENPPTSDDWGSPEWDAYVAKFNDVQTHEAFLNTRSFLRSIVTANTKQTQELSCIYLVYVDIQREFFVYLVDTAEEDPCPPGCIDPVFSFNRYILDPNQQKDGFHPYITNTDTYGYLVTAGAAIELAPNDYIFAMVDISMGIVRKAQAKDIVTLFIHLILAVAVICVLGILVTHFTLMRPIARLTKTAKSYDEKEPEKTHELFVDLKIKLHDELGDLAESMKKMENDVHSKIHELTEANKELAKSQKQTEIMTELASKDGLTGVQNKVAYNADVEKTNKAISEGKAGNFGIVMIDLNYLKIINDEKGHDAGDVALIKLANITCDIFAHSPVYRTGGDEFVVILRKVDYDNRYELINKFNSEIDKLSQNHHVNSEKVSAAIGLAEFNPETDKDVDDVFKRADKAMYERKHQMKKGK